MIKAFDRVVAAFRDNGLAVIERGDRAELQAPGHSPSDRSVSIRAIEDRVLMFCHAGEQLEDVLTAVGLQKRDLFDNPKGSTYRYPDGRNVHRSPEKKFLQSGNTKGRSLFRADRVAEADTVFVVEGEQDVLAVESAGGAAVCSAMGAGKAHLFDWEPLRDKTVIVVADRDEPGREHARAVADLLRRVAKKVTIVDPAVGKDAADHIAAGQTLGQFVRDGVDGAELLDRVEAWFRRFIAVPDERDLALLTLWAAHTHLAAELYTTPRLQLDSTMPGSGKTTVLDHFSRLCLNPVQIANLSSPALLPRLLDSSMRTVLLDEVDRSLRPDKPGVQDLIGILNSGYRVGATRPVLTPTKGGGWEAAEMPTHAPVAMAGNSPQLPDDTRSRCLRVLLMPDLHGTIEDSDWEFIGEDAARLHDDLAKFAEQARDLVKGLQVDLPKRCIGRSKEKWRPLKRMAVAAGGRWPDLVDALITRGLDEDDAEREAGLRTLPPGMILLTDLHSVWRADESFVATGDLVNRLIAYNPDYWGSASPYGKALTEKRFGQLTAQASKVTSQRPGGVGRRGYVRTDLEPAWRRLGIEPAPPGESGGRGESGESGGESNRIHRDNHIHRIEPDTPTLPLEKRDVCDVGEESHPDLAHLAHLADSGGTGGGAVHDLKSASHHAVKLSNALDSSDSVAPSSPETSRSSTEDHLDDADEKVSCRDCGRDIPVHMHASRERGVCSRCTALATAKARLNGGAA